MRMAVLVVTCTLSAFAGIASAEPPLTFLDFTDAQRLFYNARYEDAAARALELRATAPEDLDTYELRTSALLFQLKRALNGAADKDKAFKACASCQPLMAAFQGDLARGQELARARLKANPADEQALFYLGKLDLNYVWLMLGTLGRRTGWNEYREARHSLQTVLKRSPQHVRARVAHAWIEYIVDTEMPFGTKWILGGGDKKRALRTVQEAATADADFYSHTEAIFALWDLQVRQKSIEAAVSTARLIARDFPENPEVEKFLRANGAAQ
jgi:tetratricopeptide (TPR) repeat protein